MADETENLVLELLRGLRGDIGGVRAEMDKRFAGVEGRLGAIEECFDAIETQLEGWRYVFVATTGSLFTDLKGHETRIAALEGTPA